MFLKNCVIVNRITKNTSFWKTVYPNVSRNFFWNVGWYSYVFTDCNWDWGCWNYLFLKNSVSPGGILHMRKSIRPLIHLNPVLKGPKVQYSICYMITLLRMQILGLLLIVTCYTLVALFVFPVCQEYKTYILHFVHQCLLSHIHCIEFMVQRKIISLCSSLCTVMQNQFLSQKFSLNNCEAFRIFPSQISRQC